MEIKFYLISFAEVKKPGPIATGIYESNRKTIVGKNHSELSLMHERIDKSKQSEKVQMSLFLLLGPLAVRALNKITKVAFKLKRKAEKMK